LLPRHTLDEHELEEEHHPPSLVFDSGDGGGGDDEHDGAFMLMFTVSPV
jgi:hypothetical protein